MNAIDRSKLDANPFHEVIYLLQHSQGNMALYQEAKRVLRERETRLRVLRDMLAEQQATPRPSRDIHRGTTAPAGQASPTPAAIDIRKLYDAQRQLCQSYPEQMLDLLAPLFAKMIEQYEQEPEPCDGSKP